MKPEPLYQRHSTLWVCLALVIMVVLLYGQVAGHEFVILDDLDYILNDPHVNQGLTWDGVQWAFAGVHISNWHPLTALSHMLDVELFGLEPGGPHLINMAFHATNAVLLFLALRWMTAAFWPCALVAALFAVHPLRVESVAWASERKDVLSGLFWMLTLLAYAGYVRRPAPRRYLLVFTSLALGLMAKPMLVTLPFVLLLLDFWPLGRWRWPIHRLVLEKLPLLGLAAASSVVTLLAVQSGHWLRALESVPIGSRLGNAALAYVGYLRKTIWPTDLAVFYPHPVLDSQDASLLGPALGAGLLLGSVSFLMVYLARRRPYLAVGWFWYLGTLLPVIGLIQVGDQAMADRYTYLPLVGIYVLVAWGARDLAARWPGGRWGLTTASAVLLGGCMTATWFQVGTWRNSVLLWEQAIRVTRDNYVAHNVLGLALSGQGNLAQAEAQFERALRIDPDYAIAHYNLGIALLRQGKLVQAEAQFERTLQISPDDAPARQYLQYVRARLGTNQ